MDLAFSTILQSQIQIFLCVGLGCARCFKQSFLYFSNCFPHSAPDSFSTQPFLVSFDIEPSELSRSKRHSCRFKYFILSTCWFVSHRCQVGRQSVQFTLNASEKYLHLSWQAFRENISCLESGILEKNISCRVLCIQKKNSGRVSGNYLFSYLAFRKNILSLVSGIQQRNIEEV